MLNKSLERIGFKTKEAKVYLACLELGEATIDRISKKSGIKRTTLYDIIESLKLDGVLGSTIKAKKKYYFAVDPRELSEKIDQRKKTLDSIMPQLLSIANFFDYKPRIKFFEGIEGIKEIHMDTLRYPHQPIQSWITEEMFDVLDEDFIAYYLPKRINEKIALYVIAPDIKIAREYKELDRVSLRETRIDSSPNFSTKVEIDLYGQNKVGIMSFYERIGLIIESEKIASTLKCIFNAHWDRLKC